MKKLKGFVVSTQLNKTCTVSIDTKFRHPKYKKIIRKSKKYMVHCEDKVNVGDFVEICETRPISKLKSFKLLNIISKS